MNALHSEPMQSYPLAVFLFVVACSKEPSKAQNQSTSPTSSHTASQSTQKSSEPPTLEEQWLRLAEDQARVIQGNISTCDTLAKALETWNEKHGVEFKKLNQQLNKAEKQSEQEKERMKKLYGARIEHIVKTMINTAMKCEQHTRVQELLNFGNSEK